MLEINLSSASVNELLQKAYDMYRKYTIAEDKNLVVGYLENDIRIITDEILSVRSH